MILACVPETDAAVWLSARNRLSTTWSVTVCPHQALGAEAFKPGLHAIVIDGRDAKVGLPANAQASWLLLLVEDNGFLPENVPGYALAHAEDVRLERIGRPIVGRIRVGVYRRQGFTAEMPMLQATYGPGVQPQGKWAALWPTEPYKGLGLPLWRDDPGVLDTIFAAVNGEGPLWIQPGFAFPLPPMPMTLRNVSGVPHEGILCASTDEPGAWVLLSAQDIATLLGVGRSVTYDELHGQLGEVAIAGLLEWATRFPSA